MARSITATSTAAKAAPSSSNRSSRSDVRLVITEEFAQPGDPGCIGTLSDARRLFAQLVAPSVNRQIEQEVAEMLKGEVKA